MQGVKSPRAASEPQYVRLDQIPRWLEQEVSSSPSQEESDSVLANRTNDSASSSGLASSQYYRFSADTSPSHEDDDFADPLTSGGQPREYGSRSPSRTSPKFPVDPVLNEKVFLWRGPPWPLEVDAVVNSTNENIDPSMSSPGLFAEAGSGLAEECATLGGCRTGEAKITGAYELPARRVIHVVGPRYTDKYATAAENSLSRCYRACLEQLVDNELGSIALPCIYSDAKGYPREPAAHVAIRTIRRFLERHGNRIDAVVFCLSDGPDVELYRLLLSLYFPRTHAEELCARKLLPPDCGDENGEIVIDERRIRIGYGPGGSEHLPPFDYSNDRAIVPYANGPGALVTAGHWGPDNEGRKESLLDPSFVAMSRDPDARRMEVWQRAAAAQAGWMAWAQWLGLDVLLLLAPALPAGEQLALHSRWVAQSGKCDLSEIEDMKIVYRGGVDTAGRPIIVVVGAHFLPRSLDMDLFILHAVKEIEPIIHRPFTIVYFHAATNLALHIDLAWLKRLQLALGPQFRRNLHAVYAVHPTLPLKTLVWSLHLLLDQQLWSRFKYVNRLLELFRYVPREQMTIPEFIFMHDVEINPQDAMAISMRSRLILPPTRLLEGLRDVS